MRCRALLLAILSYFLFASPLHAQDVNKTCALDAPITDGGVTFPQCPASGLLNGITQGGAYNSARLDPNNDLSSTPMYLFSAGLCRYVDSRGTTAALFVPFNSQAEWEAFLANAPSGVHTAQCCVPRSLVVGDVPPVSTVPNLPACSTGWKFDGLADPNDFTKVMATPSGTANTSTFSLNSGYTDSADMPIASLLPIARDDILAQLPKGAAAGKPYNARYSCVTTSGNTTSTQYQIIQFALQCNNANWAYTGAGCASGTLSLFNEACPSGQSGTIVKQVVRECPSGNVSVQILSNTCTGNCVPGQVGDSFTAQCPAGQTGIITRGNFRQCPSGNIVQQDISNTCTDTPTCSAPPANLCPSGQTGSCTSQNGQCVCTCSGGACQTGQTDLGITTTQCPNNQAGVIQTHNFRSCTNTNNQCVCNLAATEEDNCSTGATCTPSTPAQCGAGTAAVCTNSGPGNECKCLCAPVQCTPRTVTTETRQCPSGQTGTRTVEVTKICSSTQTGGATSDGNGCFCTTTEVEKTNTCTNSNCPASTDLGNTNRSCPNGQVGTVVINTKKICVMQNNQCVCHNEETEVTRACEAVQCIPSTDLGNSTQACPAGQTGQIVINTKKICQLSVGCSLGNCPPGTCSCHNETTQVSNTCTPIQCSPSTDLGTQVLACPAPQTGPGITVRTIKECTASNNQCVCVNRYTVLKVQCSGNAQCVPSTDLGTETRQCPAGQTGSIVVKKVKTCSVSGSGNQCQCNCSVQEIPVSNTCTTVQQCTPSTRTETAPCPSGQSGSIIKTIKHICDCVGGRDVVVNVQNTCTAQCTPSSRTENLGCPDGYTGSHTRTTQHVCDCPGGRDVVTESNTCTCPTTPPISCVPDTLIKTSYQSCRGNWDYRRYGSGQIKVERHRVCQAVTHGGHSQCVCHNEDRYSGTCVKVGGGHGGGYGGYGW